mmetsp:Transcript_4388/g.8108  ORF Transcript_4388/g.8108 Transcript_4388/m.8108 type:complete len:286 (+) Transcript_4388:2857-3714(+)
MHAGGRVELHHACLAHVRGGLGAGHRQHRPGGVPLDARRAEARVNQHHLLVNLVAHELDAPVVQSDGQHRGGLVSAALRGVVARVGGGGGGSRAPIDADDVGGALHALEAVEHELGNRVAVAVVDVHLPLHGAEEDEAPVRGPLHQRERQAQLLAPQAVAIHGAHDHSAVLVDDADLLAVRSPLHVLHHRLVAVVDHLLEPHPLVKHPHDDQPVLIRRGKLAVVLVPIHNHHRAVVALQGLVHGQVAAGRRISILGVLCCSRLQLEHLQKTILTTTSDPSLLTVP